MTDRSTGNDAVDPTDQVSATEGQAISTESRLRQVVRHLHPFLFVLAPVLALYSLNWGEVTPTDMIRPVLVMVVGSVLLWSGLYFWYRRNTAQTSLGVSVFLLAFFLYGQWQQLFLDIQRTWREENGVSASSHPSSVVESPVIGYFAATMWVALLILLLVVCRRAKRDLSGIAYLAGIALIVPSLFRVGATEIHHARVASIALAKNGRSPAVETVATSAQGITPDLYVVVLDAYARQDVLKTAYGLDNEPFLKALEERGFIVARHSRANYERTPLAIASAFNLDYIPRSDKVDALRQMQPMIDHNQIAALLAKQGYHFISIPTGFLLTATPSADLILDEKQGNALYLAPFPLPFEELLLQETLLAAIPRNSDFNFNIHQQRLLSAFVHLGDAAALPYPKFVFAHVLAPHPPFVFDAQGKPVVQPAQAIFSLEDGNSYPGVHDLYRPGYAAQVQFVNHEVLSALDQMQKRSHRPYIVVLMGDHGARQNTDWTSLKRTDIHEAFSNLFAVYCSPGVGSAAGRAALQKRLSGVVTPITALRQVMNTGFGMTFPDLPDRSFYSTKGLPCDFNEITDQLTEAPVATNYTMDSR